MDETELASFRSVQAISGWLGPWHVAEAAGTDVETAATAAFRGELSQALAALEHEQHGRRDGVMVAVPDQLASLLQSRLLEDPPGEPVERIAAARNAGRDVFEVKFDQRDVVGWLRSLLTWVKGLRKQPWLDPPAVPQPVGSRHMARIALLSDWGTGLYGAPISAASIAADPRGFDLVMHLGDVYYSGTEREVEQRFLRFWPRVERSAHASEAPLSRGLNANHEMYTGGVGYFRKMLPAFAQTSSCCALETSGWLLIGLDTAYQDFDLDDRQLPWVDALLARARESGRRVILFSHHQPFSHFDRQGTKLIARLARALAEQRLFAWYWGHEHRCILYDRHPAWSVRGRCIGHGGYPHFRDPLSHLPAGPATIWRRLPAANLVPGGLILDAPNDYITGEEEKYGANGYVTLELDGSKAHEFVHAPDGTVLFESALE